MPITAAIRDALVEAAVPHDARTFEANRSAFVARSTRKIERWKAALAPFRGAKIVVMHDSWSYFAERFGLQIVAAAEPHPGVPPSPAELAALFERMREAGVKVLDRRSAFESRARAPDRRARRGAQAVTLPPSGHDYMRLFDENVREARRRAEDA